MAEETINEVRSATSGLVPPMLLDVAYIEALPRDHLTKMEDNEVGRCDRTEIISSKYSTGASAGGGEKDPFTRLNPTKPRRS